MTPADRRINELIEKWLTSIDLHLQYAELDDAAYARVQAWPRHDRPTRWVLEVARQKILELKNQCEMRQAMGDGRFSESLELMAFLANLVGVQHIQRFIPLADPGRAAAAPSPAVAPAVAAKRPIEAPASVRSAPAASASPSEETREIPVLKPQAAVQPRAPKAPQPERPAPPAPAAPAPNAAKTAAVSEDLKSKIVADAVRLLKWGKPWHELGDLIARIADRPPAAEIRKVLRAHRTEIEQKAAGG